ncbi:hypothetical protein QFC21_001599 [Naganishia friedmannii]|uniref:Uncharacterized protein n=1 Tax=Naganishia friedmannii TaxID=89922 RepID=A0ACC2W0I3_9TREE|nr:hypothetical protein QFC21_001599 [Naganishia friedmannii]
MHVPPITHTPEPNKIDRQPEFSLSCPARTRKGSLPRPNLPSNTTPSDSGDPIASIGSAAGIRPIKNSWRKCRNSSPPPCLSATLSSSSRASSPGASADRLLTLLPPSWPPPRNAVRQKRQNIVVHGVRSHSLSPVPPPSDSQHTSSIPFLGASTARIDFHTANGFPQEKQLDFRERKRVYYQHAANQRSSHLNLLWGFSFLVGIFLFTGLIYSSIFQFLQRQRSDALVGTGQFSSFKSGAQSRAIQHLSTRELDIALRCKHRKSNMALETANTGVNAISGVVAEGKSTSRSLSSDIWRWKKHKGIAYANSHNDEMQGDKAFTLAHSLGLAAIEADVWLAPAPADPDSQGDSESVLLVGHEDQDLHDARTLKKLYLDPIWDILESVNVGNNASHGWKGVFTERGVPDQTLLLMIDTKNKIDATYAELQRLLIPFVEKGYLSHFTRSSPDSEITDGKLTIGPLTVIGTGDTPIHSILSANPRYVFKDGPLTNLTHPIMYADPRTGNMSQVDWHPSFAPMASAKFTVAAHASYFMSSTLFLPIRQAFNLAFPTPAFVADADSSRHIREAHARGIESRWWGVARHPKPLRQALWGYIKDIGTDWLNADDLEDVAQWYKRRTEGDQLCI